MDLRNFIKTTLTDIIAGVKDAREAVEEHDAMVGSDPVYGNTSEAKIITDNLGRQCTNVEFDVVLAQTDSKEKKEGIGVFLGSVGLGTHNRSNDEYANNTRIKFVVPIVLPGKSN